LARLLGSSPDSLVGAKLEQMVPDCSGQSNRAPRPPVGRRPVAC
jgi:hypothetical protein